jgi:heptosyltransferase II
VNSSPLPLIVRLRNYVGDVVLSIPALEKLRDSGYELHLIGKPWAEDLLAAYGWTTYRLPAQFRERVSLYRKLRCDLLARDPGFDRRINALTFVTAFSSALDMRVAGLKAAGYASEARGWLLRKAAPYDPSRHAIDLYWDVAKLVHGNVQAAPRYATLNVHERYEREKAQRLLQANIRSRYVVLVPYPGGEIDGVSKKWGEFRSVVAPLLARGLTLVMAPSPSEIEFTKEHYPEAVSLPDLSLGAYAALLRDAALTISNDTGPGHMAASVGGRLLSVLGPTKQSQWGARGPLVTILQGTNAWPRTDEVIHTMLRMLDAQDTATIE